MKEGCKVKKVNVVMLVQKDHKVLGVYRGNKDQLVLEDQQEKEEKEVCKDHKVFKVYVVLQEHQVRKVVLDQEVCEDQ